MGCWCSRVEREEVVTRCKARRRYTKELVAARHAFASAHTLYLRSLRSTGAALLHFADSLPQHDPHHHQKQTPAALPPHRPPAPPTMSPSSETNTSVTASPCLPPPPPPSSWDFWDPFASSSSRSPTEEEWEAATTTVSPSAPASTAPAPSVVSGVSKQTATSTSELAMVVSRSGKELGEIIKEVDEYFLKAANGGCHVSLLLEAPSSGFCGQRLTTKVYNYGRSLSPFLRPWGTAKSSSIGSFGRLSEAMSQVDQLSGGDVSTSHCSTVERLYAWEKKLCSEVKNAEKIKSEHKKRVTFLRKQEAHGGDYIKIEKNKKEIQRLESRLMVASQAMEVTSDEIIRLREVELYPQLLELAKGLMHMWRSMYECHQVQTHIVQQLKFINNLDVGMKPASEIHRQATLQLEHEVQQWHSTFCNLVKSQREYIHSLTGWLRLCLFQFNHHPLTKTQQNSAIYSLCEEWQLALDRIPDKVASEGIKSFLTVIHSVVVQQAEEQKLKKKSDALFKELDKRFPSLEHWRTSMVHIHRR